MTNQPQALVLALAVREPKPNSAKPANASNHRRRPIAASPVMRSAELKTPILGRLLIGPAAKCAPAFGVIPGLRRPATGVIAKCCLGLKSELRCTTTDAAAAAAIPSSSAAAPLLARMTGHFEGSTQLSRWEGRYDGFVGLPPWASV
jgi:hypothetical protein